MFDVRRKNWALALAAVGLMAAVPSWAAKEGSDKKDGADAPTVLGEWNLENDFAKIEQQWGALMKLADDAKVFAYQTDAVSAWSVGQQVTHVRLAMTGQAEVIKEMLADPDEGAGLARSAMSTSILSSGMIPRGVGKAPASITPGDDPSRKEVKGDLKKARKAWRKLEKNIEKIDGAKGTRPHQTGPLTASDWVRLMATHNAHHLKIVNDIIASVENGG